MTVESAEQLEGLRAAGALVRETIAAVRAAARPGVTTGHLDAIAREAVERRGGASGPILTYGYPGFICLSVDDEVVHGIPGQRVLAEGDLLKIDVALELRGYHADSAVTVVVGDAARPGDRRMIRAVDAALASGVRAARPGATLRSVGAAVERVVTARGFRVLRELTGHGIGRAMHEPPTVHSWAAPDATTRLEPGMVFTIEPMIVAGSPRIYVDRDDWTIRTVDRGRGAHAEHTVMVADEGAAVVLT